MRRAEIILCTMGTRGDILPFVALARTLIEKGFTATILSNENWKGLVEQAGVRFHSIAPQDPSQSGRNDRDFYMNYTVPSFSTSFSYVEEQSRRNGVVLLIYRSNMLGMQCAAERFGLPHVKVALQPSSITSLESPPWPLNAISHGPLGIVAKRVLVPGLHLFAEALYGHGRQRNRFIRSAGLKPPKIGRRHRRSEDMILVMTPKWFAKPPSDWPDNCHCVGFPFFDQPRHDPDIDAFIQRYGKPVIFTPGTGVTDVDGFFQKAAAICEAANVPGLFLTGQPIKLRFAKKCGLLHKEFADLGDLLPRARLIVHHGGVGTMAQALRAGIPQIIVPDRFDQPDNATRIATLGLGAAIMQDSLSPQGWAQLIDNIINDEALAVRLERASHYIGKENAMLKSTALISDLLAQKWAGIESGC